MKPWHGGVRKVKRRCGDFGVSAEQVPTEIDCFAGAHWEWLTENSWNPRISASPVEERMLWRTREAVTAGCAEG